MDARDAKLNRRHHNHKGKSQLSRKTKPADDFQTLYMVAPGTLNIESAAVLDAVTPNMGVETGNLVDIAPPRSAQSASQAMALPPTENSAYRRLVPGAPTLDTEINKVSKVRMQTSQVLDPVVMGLLTVGLAGCAAQAYHSSSDPVYVGLFALGAALSGWKLLEIRAEALLDLDDTR